MTTAPTETLLTIQGDLPSPMLGVLHRPTHGVPVSGTGVVIVNGGAQYRAGAHRLFVQLARHLAAHGHTVLRFDFPGQGDSPGEPVAYQSSAPHVGAALDALHLHAPGLRRTALCGLCDGASASLLYLHATGDRRITHLALLNPWVEDAQAQARAQLRHYYTRRLLMPDFWRKLLRGAVGGRQLRDWLASLALARQRPAQARLPGLARAPEPPPAARMATAWRRFGGHIALLLSEADQTAQTFCQHADQTPAWQGWREHPGLTLHTMPDADHTCSDADSLHTLLDTVVSSLRGEGQGR